MTEDVRPTALSVTLRLLGLRKQIGIFAKPCSQLRYGRRRGYVKGTRVSLASVGLRRFGI
jgi:hypothetical protein